MIGKILRMVSVRFFILVFWILIIIGFLFLPRVIKYVLPEKSITIFTFPELIDVNFIQRFEQETGIAVHVSYYANNDELLVKMRQTKGVGYDIILPSDYLVESLIQEGLLQPIDKSKLPFWQDIYPKFLGHYFDASNTYSIPFFWAIYGIGYNKSFFGGHVPEATWKLLFDEKFVKYHIGMINNPREAVLIAAYYLFGSIDNLDGKKLEQVKALLRKQKAWVEAYTDLRTDYLLMAHTAPVVAALSSEMVKSQQDDPDIDFLIPREGSFLVIDSIVLPKATKKLDLIYEFIKYLYRPEVLVHHANVFGFFPVIPPDKFSIPFSPYVRQSFYLIDTPIHLDFFRNIVSIESLLDIWLGLKAY